MKRVGRLIVTLAGVGTVIGFAYRGPIVEIANAFKEEVAYFFSINADSALDGEVGNKDIDAMANNPEGIGEGVDSPDWDMESATGEVFGEIINRFPFIKESGDWVKSNVLKKGKELESTETTGSQGIESGEDLQSEGLESDDTVESQGIEDDEDLQSKELESSDTVGSQGIE